MTDVVFFRDDDGSEPVKEWLIQLPYKARRGVITRFKKLRKKGRELERPTVAKLEDNLYELRWKYDGVNYRILFFWDKDIAVILTNGFQKSVQKVPEPEKRLARRRRAQYFSYQ